MLKKFQNQELKKKLQELLQRKDAQVEEPQLKTELHAQLQEELLLKHRDRRKLVLQQLEDQHQEQLQEKVQQERQQEKAQQERVPLEKDQLLLLEEHQLKKQLELKRLPLKLQELKKLPKNQKLLQEQLRKHLGLPPLKEEKALLERVQEEEDDFL